MKIELDVLEAATLCECIDTEIADAEAEADTNESQDFKVEMAKYIVRLRALCVKLGGGV